MRHSRTGIRRTSGPAGVNAAAPNRNRGSDTLVPRAAIIYMYTLNMPVKPSLLIEFLGLPGSGKTTLARRVVPILQADRIPARLVDPEAETRHIRPSTGLHRLISVARLMKPTGTAILSEPNFALRLTTAIFRSNQPSIRDSLKVLNNWFRVRTALLRSSPAPGVHLFDQGLFQAWWAVEFRARNPTEIASYFHRSSQILPDMLIILRASHATIQRRLDARPAEISRLEKQMKTDPSAIPKAVSAFEVVSAGLNGRSSTQGALRILELDATRDDSLEANTQQVVTAIRKCWKTKVQSSIRAT